MKENAQEILEEIQEEFREKDFQISVKFGNQGSSRFSIQGVVEQILDQNRESLFKKIIGGYQYGIEVYEKALEQKNHPDSELMSEARESIKGQSQDYLDLAGSPHRSGVIHARDMVCAMAVEKFLEEIFVAAVFIDDDRESITIGASTKYSRNQKKEEESKYFETQKEVRYWSGKDEGRAEISKKIDSREFERYRGKRGWILKIVEILLNRR